MTLEYGFGKTILKNQGKQLIQIGAVGYAEFQLTDDSGSDVSAFNRGNKDRVFGLGGELGMIWAVSKFNFFVRVIPEFGVRSRTQTHFCGSSRKKFLKNHENNNDNKLKSNKG